jgi:hypothetical protein
MPRDAVLVISCATLPGQSNLQLPQVIDKPTAEPPVREDVNKQLVGPAVPATVDRALSTVDVVESVQGVVSTAWVSLEPLSGLLNIPALGNLVKAIDELAKVCTIISL